MWGVFLGNVFNDKECMVTFLSIDFGELKIERVKNELVSLKEKRHGEEKTSCKELRRAICQ